MCGRFTISITVGLAERFGVQGLAVNMTPRYNIAPSQPVPVIIHSAGSGRLVVEMTWGLVPSWHSHERKNRPLINARAETLCSLPSFREAVNSRRCIIPADGFYEWAQQGRMRVPHYIHRIDGALFGFAGVYSATDNKEDHPLPTFTIITTNADRVVAPIHDRMPAILQERDEEIWLDPTLPASEALQRILAPYPQGLLESYPVSSRVNDPAIEDPSLTRKIEEQRSLF